MLSDPPSSAKARGRTIAEHQEMVRKFSWEIRSINGCLEDVRQLLAHALGITGPQWMVLVGLADLKAENGVPVNVVSKLIHADASFVTLQSKALEKKGLVRRKSCTSDARVVRLSLTETAYKHLANVATQQKALDEFIFGEFSAAEFAEFAGKLAAVRRRLEKGSLENRPGVLRTSCTILRNNEDKCRVRSFNFRRFVKATQTTLAVVSLHDRWCADYDMLRTEPICRQL
ncbi:MarR family transcriptional regulator [Bradyrhizobium sp. ISRA435]|nr:MarR family transcriptional regulator [Bradyrhizobium sp. ISRA435]